MRCQRNTNLKYRYGITVKEYDRLLENQKGRCAICKRTPKRKRLMVDHDHQTKTIRGILCYSCNTALAAFGDNINGIKKVIKYLENPPCL